MSIDRDPAAVERAFRESGAPWPARGEITFGSIYSTQHVLETHKPWACRFFRAESSERFIGDKVDSPGNPWPEGTNLTYAHTYDHDFIIMRVVLIFRSTHPGGVPGVVERHAKLDAWVGMPSRARLTKLPRFVPRHTAFGAELYCGQPTFEQMALQVQVLFDCIIIVP